MTNDRTRAPGGLWHRAAHALGKWFAGMVQSPDDRRQPATKAAWTDYPRFPSF
ncbi:MAG TPA: hypothetical protein VG651_10600 [Stellaceae bacterium]|nr:hypothetical protein [Stellaceae bacterium]